MILEGIVLAAGLSSRAKKNKLLLKINGKSIIENTILNIYDFCQRIIVVGGHRIEDIWQVTKFYPKVDLIYNHSYPDGMFSSIKTGLKYAKGKKVFIAPGDCPFIRDSTYKKISQAKGSIIAPRYKGKRGHPVLISSYYKNEILESKQFNNMRDFIRTKNITFVDVEDSGILMDIDTMEDYYKAINTMRKVNPMAK